MAFKFVRACDWTYTNTNGVFCATLRLAYEMWCYCVHGGPDPLVPGGVPSGHQNFPTNYFEGTSVLATGTDGVTSASSSQTFTSPSASFTSSMVGKHLVVWKPGSGSGDDSVYPIRAVPNGNTLIVESRCGGTPDPITLRPGFTDRSEINYRVIDLSVAQALSPSNGNYLVFQTAASAVNAGQSNTQFQLLYRSSGQSFGLVVSPGGTWNGVSAFGPGATTEITVNPWAGFIPSTGYLNVIADSAALIFFVETPQGRMCFHLEVPVRMYTLGQDPNPVVYQMNTSLTTFFSTSSTTDGWGGGFRTVGTDNVARLSRTIVRGMSGDGTDSTFAPAIPGGSQTAPWCAFNPLSGKVHSSEVMMGTLAIGHYNFTRMKLRAARMGPAYYPRYTRFGDFGEWIHMKNGIYLPWDNALLPFDYFPITVP